MERADVRLEHRLLPHLDHVLVDLRLRLVEGLLDPGRMDAPVLKQLVEREAGDLAPHAVEPREQDRARGVVDDEVDPGQRLEGADVAALPADDAALQLVRLQLHHRDRRLHRVARRHPLHHRGQDASRAPVGVTPGLLLHLPDHAGAVVAQLVLELAHQDLLGLPGAEPGHPLELAQLPRLLGLQLLADVVQVPAAVVEGPLPLAQLLRLDGQRALLRPQPLLEARDLGAAREQLLLEPVARDRHGRGLGHGRSGRRLSKARALRRPWLGCDPRAHGARALHEHDNGHRDSRRDQRRNHDLHLRLLTRRTGADSTFGVLSGPACGSETTDDYGPSRALLSGRSEVVVRIMFR
jgi:hypothetical protein